MVLDRPPRNEMAVAMAVTGVVIEVPAGGLAKAQGLYQLILLRVLGAQVMVGLEGSGVPPGEKGLRTGIARAVPPAGPLVCCVGREAAPPSGQQRSSWWTSRRLPDRPTRNDSDTPGPGRRATDNCR